MSFRRFRCALAALGAAILASSALSLSAQSAEVVVFAAASTTNALTELSASFTAKTGNTIKPSFAASSTLAKQVEQGAPAAVFISADAKWADYLADKKLLADGTRQDILGNELQLVTASDSPFVAYAAPITKGLDFTDLLGKDGRLATGDPDHVPVGLYAKQALTAMGLWEKLEPRLARAESVRAALALVERGEAPLGIVYRTDAAISKKVKLVGVFDPSLCDPVVFTVALVAGHDTPEAKAFLAYLTSPDAKAVFSKYGFTPLF